MTITTRRKRAAVAAAAIGSAGASAIAAAPAAAEIPSTCAGNAICEYEDGGYRLPVHWWGAGSADLNYQGNVYGSDPNVRLDDSISAIVNNNNRWVKFYQDDNRRGYDLCLAPGAGAPNLEFVAIPGPLPNWSNRISGHESFGSSRPGGCDTVVTAQACSN
jgi:hypothetical protein